MLLFARIVISLVSIIRERASTHLLSKMQDMRDLFVDGMKKQSGLCGFTLTLVHSTPEHRGHLTCLHHPIFPPFVPSLPIHIPPVPRPWVWLQL